MKTNLDATASNDALSQCEREHERAVAELAGAEVALKAASDAYDAALGQGRDAALTARRAQGDAEVDRDVAKRAVELLAQRLDDARSAAAAAETNRLADVARGRVDDFASAARRDLKAMAGLARRLARLHAEAGIAREAAIRAGVSEADLPNVEDFRRAPRFPQEVLKTERVKRYIHPYTTHAIDGDQEKHIRVSGPDAYLMGGPQPMRLSDHAIFDRTVVLVAQAPVPHRSFMSALAVPGLMDDDAPGWTPPDSLSPHAVLAHLDAIEGAPAPDRSDRRERRVDLRRVPAAELKAAEA